MEDVERCMARRLEKSSGRLSLDGEIRVTTGGMALKAHCTVEGCTSNIDAGAVNEEDQFNKDFTGPVFAVHPSEAVLRAITMCKIREV